MDTNSQEKIASKVTIDSSIVEKVFMENVRENKASRRWKIIFRFINIAVILTIIVLISSSISNSSVSDINANAKHIAVIDIKGAIMDGGATNADFVINALQKAFANNQAKAIILNINSPGGSPVQSSLIYDEIVALKFAYPNKKVYAVIADLGASAAYHIASSAHAIYANRNSIVGSIGVIMFQMDYQGLLGKVGLKSRVKKSGIYKDIGNPARNETLFEKKFLKSLTNKLHNNFISDVKRGRGKKLVNKPMVLFSGLFWDGKQAKKLGLIDGLSNIYRVAEDIVGIKEMVNYTEEDPFNKWMNIVNSFANPELNFAGKYTPVIR